MVLMTKRRNTTVRADKTDYFPIAAVVSSVEGGVVESILPDGAVWKLCG